MINIEKNFKKHKNHNPLCKACDDKAYRKVTIETTWFRGDDDVFLLCEKHTKMARENLDDLYKDIETVQNKRKDDAKKIKEGLR